MGPDSDASAERETPWGLIVPVDAEGIMSMPISAEGSTYTHGSMICRMVDVNVSVEPVVACVDMSVPVMGQGEVIETHCYYLKLFFFLADQSPV